jgi:ferredoxin
MKVTIEPKKCIAAGMCVAHAPEVFDQDDDNGIVVLLDEHPGPDQVTTFVTPPNSALRNSFLSRNEHTQ